MKEGGREGRKDTERKVEEIGEGRGDRARGKLGCWAPLPHTPPGFCQERGHKTPVA